MKYFSVFSDETVEQAISKHSTGYNSIEEAIEDSNTFISEKCTYKVIDENKVVVWPKVLNRPTDT